MTLPSSNGPGKLPKSAKKAETPPLGASAGKTPENDRRIERNITLDKVIDCL